MLAAALPALAQTCAPPSSLVTSPGSGIVNNYYPGNGNLAVGATGLTLGTLDARGASTALAVGDLLLIIQVQDATINTSNNNTYGDGTGAGTGSTSVGRSGLHEFVRVTAVAGSAVTFTPPLTNSYEQANATGSTLQKRYQVVRAMQYSAVTLTGLTTPPWNGLSGGVVVADVRDTLTLGNGTVEGEAGRAVFVAGKGFRGGAGRRGTAAANVNNWAINPTAYAQANLLEGTKAEGIAGAPISISNYTGNWGFRTSNPPTVANLTVLQTTPGYPGGSFARGAPANGGGGGTDGSTTANAENAGGGGGGNYGPGGIGGRPWNRPLIDSGGRGGAGYAGTLAFNRVFMGGGGGSGGTNQGTSDNAVYTNQARACDLGTDGLCSGGASGGGIVLLRARTITGSGTIDARGAHGYAVTNDAAGGGGAGGSVILQTSLGGNASIDVRGGDGGNAWAGNAVTVVAGSQTNALAARHGPGGAGGGGFIAYSPNSMGVSALVDGGVPGKTIATLVPDEHYGSSGYNGGLTTFQSPNTPGVVPAAQCDPSLSLTKTNNQTSLSSPGTTTYTFTVLNSGIGASVGTITVADKLPAGLSVVPGPLTLSGANAASWSCAAANATDILCTSTGTISGSASSTFALAAAVSSANGSSLVNRAQVSGGGDPGKTTPGAPVTEAAACTANDTPAGCALDSDTVVAPNLVLTKSDGSSWTTRGGTTTYTLVVSNTGGTPTTGTIRLIDVLPTGLAFGGTGTAGGFVCTVSAPNITCDRTAAIAAGASVTMTLVVTVGANAPSSATNLARVGGGGDPSPAKSVPVAASVTACASPVPPATTASDGNNGCAADTNEVRYVSLSMSKDDGAPFMSLNGTLVYSFAVTNNGTATSTAAITFRDVLPPPMNFPAALTVGGANAADWSCTRVSATTATCSSAVLIAPGAVSAFSLPVNVGAVVTTAPNNQYTNKARIAGGGDVSTGFLPSIPGDASVTACIATGDGPGCAIDLNAAQDAPRIRLAKSHANPQARSPGDAIAFSLVVSNSGGSAAAIDSVRLIDVLPTGLTYVSVVPSTGWTCTATAPVIQCRNSAALAAGAQGTVTVNATVAANATNPLVNDAKASGSNDPQNSSPMTTATTSLAIVTACVGTDAPSYGCATDDVPLNADLQIGKLQRTGTGAFGVTTTVVPVNGTVQFQIDVTNNGPSQVTGALIADTVPTNFSTVTWTCTVQNAGTGTGTTACGTASGSGNAISFASGLMKSGAVLRIVVNATALTATDFDGVINTATVGTPTGIVDGTPTNNIGTVTTRIGSVNLGITKTNGVSTVISGTTTTYTITVGNSGTFPADGARLYDPAVTGLSCTTPPTCVASGAGTTCPASITVAQIQNGTVPTGVAIPTFGPGGLLTLSYTCSVTATGQ